ncbi:transcription antitermination factor NusB [Paracoccus sp. P2]|uniref:Transcription antitermination protein NusB n=1 Tax=Paracoccus pantotrophus TaxID=82367 RepID=A0A1I5I102_PARPN|nr:transcription antitermination factor NusB [Paracoccus pantotrophus]MDF3854912.1 transcription antitermination factor NusB [Paracoccus pantotrophus]QFG37461.1 transcription antitermination factor NusB [Paracoccus pantotrophus]QLH15073.1 transcription antitermination factor NusB [Paracoccus pantotrophus]RDD93802.1 transcription antitermination factor NusB [Paracoccus pantotrophus]RKS52092.1 NusB antitermination factor [Paracoccus pantotrophus]
MSGPGDKTRRDGDRQARQARAAAARLYAVQALFQMEAGGQSADRVQREFLNWRIGREDEDDDIVSAEADQALFTRIVDDAVTWQSRIDQMTDRALVAKWPIDRIDPVLRSVFRAAGAELVTPKTPPKVVIAEYVRLAQAFFAEGRESKFVNAVLDHMAREARPEAF